MKTMAKWSPFMSRRAHLTAGGAVLLAFAAAVALIAAAGIARADSEHATAGCGTKVVFLVWPKGHPAIPRIAEFPEIRNPHIELYRTFSSGYDVRFAGAWIISGRPPTGITRGSSYTTCVNYGATLTKGTVPNPRVITRETAVRCVVPGAAVTDVVLRAGGVADLYLHTGDQLLAHGHVTGSSAVLTVPSDRCTLTAPPRP